MNAQHTFTNLKAAWDFYFGELMAGKSVTLETIVPNKEWAVNRNEH